MAKEILEVLFDSYKEVKPIETCLTVKTLAQLEEEDKIYNRY
jgi:hypothetical protein